MDQERPCILVADDEAELVALMRRALSSEGYSVLAAFDGAEALALVHKYRPDLIVLDIVMPHLDGLEVCRRLRQDPDLAALPVLFLSVRSAIENRLNGWETGCDEYLTKPFDIRELKAHIRALLRRASITARASPASQDRVLQVGSLTLDLKLRRVTTKEKVAQLTPTEFSILRYLAQHPSELFSSQHLLKNACGYAPESASSGLVRWHIKNLRGKIESDAAHPVYLRTVPRHGYMLVSDE
jgi:DNA-binding response OmpR family regulator